MFNNFLGIALSYGRELSIKYSTEWKCVRSTNSILRKIKLNDEFNSQYCGL